MKRLKKFKKIRIHHEGTGTLISSLLILIVLNTIFYFAFDNKLPFYIVAGFSAFLYTILVNFFRCPIRYFEQDTEKVVVAPGKLPESDQTVQYAGNAQSPARICGCV